MSISNNNVLIGTRFEDEDQDDSNSIENAGSAYFFEKNEIGSWMNVNKVVASDREEKAYFGNSVAISGDFAIIGARGSGFDESFENPQQFAGGAYIFKRDDNGSWNEIQKIVASDRDVLDFFGDRVAISGNYAVVAATEEDEDENGDNYIESAGSVYVFERNDDGIWTEVQKIVAPDRELDSHLQGDRFGYTLAISESTIVVGTEWERHNSFGQEALVNSGAAYVYERDENGIWNFIQKIVANDRQEWDQFGHSISLDNNIMVISAVKDDYFGIDGLLISEESGSAYLYEKDVENNWVFVQKIFPDEPVAYGRFGESVSISGNKIVIGASELDEIVTEFEVLDKVGAAYLFELDESDGWNETQMIFGSNRAAYDNFGFSVSISDSSFVVGAMRHSLDDMGENFLDGAGAGYMFEIVEPVSIVETQSMENDLFKLAIFPNPNNGKFSFSPLKFGGVVSIIGLDGRVILNEHILNFEEQMFDMPNLADGTYIIKLRHEEYNYVGKLIVRN